MFSEVLYRDIAIIATVVYGGVHECTISSSEQENVILLDIIACVFLNISCIQKTVQQQLEHFSSAFALIYHARIKVVT